MAFTAAQQAALDKATDRFNSGSTDDEERLAELSAE